MTHPRGYNHVQHGYLHWLMYAIAVGLGAAAAMTWDVPEGSEQGPARWIFLGFGLVFALIGVSFQHLRVRDLGDELDVRYGPLPLLGKRVPYHEIRGAARVRTTIFDGWGVHWMPGRGWTWNLWGWDCVELDLGDTCLRVGTNDAEGLVAFVEQRVAHRS